MGADLYIRSISDKTRAEYEPHFHAAAQARNAIKSEHQGCETAQKLVDFYYDAMYPDAGYFRDSYNATGVLGRLGLSWWQDCPIDDDGLLKGADLIWFRDTVRNAKLRKVTREQLIEHHAAVDDDENSPEAWNKFYCEKRERLVAFLNRAIDFNEPIYCSV
jgi:hypothetical protein